MPLTLECWCRVTTSMNRRRRTVVFVAEDLVVGKSIRRNYSRSRYMTGCPNQVRSVTYRVQLLGDQDDPAEDELVNWFVEGKGLLLDVYTKTDADGYAIARVQYLIGETGESKVLARVAC